MIEKYVDPFEQMQGRIDCLQEMLDEKRAAFDELEKASALVSELCDEAQARAGRFIDLYMVAEVALENILQDAEFCHPDDAGAATTRIAERARKALSPRTVPDILGNKDANFPTLSESLRTYFESEQGVRDGERPVKAFVAGWDAAWVAAREREAKT